MELTKSSIFDAICDNFMLAVNNGIWAPKQNSGGLTTYCNYFVYAVCSKMGYKGFWSSDRKGPLMANEMIDLMSKEVDWMKEKDGNMGQYHANIGSLVIAAQKADVHGHVAVVRPGEMIYSGKWGKLVPRIANVGKDVFIDKGVNFAFAEEPAYFVLKSSLS